MPVDSSIYGLVKPVEQRNMLAEMAQVAQIGSAQQQNTLNALKLADYQQERQEANALARLIGDPQYQKDGRFDLNAATPALYAAAPRKAGDFIKSMGDQQKTAVETGEKRAQMNGHHFKLMGELTNLIAADPRPETVSAVLDQWEGLTGLKAGPTRQAFSGAQNAEQIRELALRLNTAAKDQAPKVETRDLGGATETYAYDPFRPQQRTVISRAEKTATPGDLLQHQDRVASRRQAEEHFQAGQSAPEYKQDAEGNFIALPKKPGSGPIAARPVVGADGKPVGAGVKGSNATEGERKAATLLTRLEGSLSQLQAALQDDPAAAKPGLISNGLRSVGMEAAANVNDSSARQRVEAAQLDILDAALTLGTGAAYTKEQLEGYRKSFFPQVGDDAAAIKDKQARLDNVIAAGRVAAGRAKSAFVPPTGPVKLTAANAEAEYAKLPSGAEFIAPDGSRRRKP